MMKKAVQCLMHWQQLRLRLCSAEAVNGLWTAMPCLLWGAKEERKGTADPTHQAGILKPCSLSFRECSLSLH